MCSIKKQQSVQKRIHLQLLLSSYTFTHLLKWLRMHSRYNIHKAHFQTLLCVCPFIEVNKNKSILQKCGSNVERERKVCLYINTVIKTPQLLYLVRETPLIWDEKVFKGERSYAPSLTRDGGGSLWCNSRVHCATLIPFGGIVMREWPFR